MIVAVEHRAVRTLAELGDILAGRAIGQEIVLRVVRGGATFEATLTLAARPTVRAPTERDDNEATTPPRAE